MIKSKRLIFKNVLGFVGIQTIPLLKASDQIVHEKDTRQSTFHEKQFRQLRLLKLFKYYSLYHL